MKTEKQRLKEEEPWTYDDLYGNPCGVNSSGIGVGDILFVVVVIGLLIWAGIKLTEIK